MEVVIILLSIAFFLSVCFGVYYYSQYRKLLNEYSELDLEHQKLRFEMILEQAKKKAIKKMLRK